MKIRPMVVEKEPPYIDGKHMVFVQISPRQSVSQVTQFAGLGTKERLKIA